MQHKKLSVMGVLLKLCQQCLANYSTCVWMKWHYDVSPPTSSTSTSESVSYAVWQQHVNQTDKICKSDCEFCCIKAQKGKLNRGLMDHLSSSSPSVSLPLAQASRSALFACVQNKTDVSRMSKPCFFQKCDLVSVNCVFNNCCHVWLLLPCSLQKEDESGKPP